MGVATFLAVTRVMPPKAWNRSVYLDINRWARQTPGLHAFMHDYALWAGLVLVTLTFLAMFAVSWWRRDVKAAALLGLGGVGTLIALGLNQVVGHAAQELRPYATLPHVLVLVGKANDYAFPSDHAVVSGALLTAVLLVGLRRPTPLAAGGADRADAPVPRRVGTIPLLVAAAAFTLFLLFARVYVGAHYPGDVIAGVLLGAVIVLVVVVALRPIAYRLADLVVPTPLAVTVRRPLP